MQPSKTLPSPVVSLAAKPSASSIARSALFMEVQFLMVLWLGHRALLSVDRPETCRPVLPLL